MNLMQRLNLGAKLAAIGAILSIPIALFAWLFLSQNFGNVAYSEREIEGSVYVSKVWQAMVAAAGFEEKMEPFDDALIAGVKAEGSEKDEKFGSAAVVESFIGKLAPGTPAGDALAEGGLAIRKIVDASNLFLDLDLDSVYLMDAAMIRLPELLNISHGVHRNIHTILESSGEVGHEELQALIVFMGKLESAIEPLQHDFETSFAANADGSVKAALEKQVNAYLALAKKFLAETDLVNDQAAGGLKPSIGGEIIEAEYRVLLQETDALWQATNAELARLIENRIANLKWTAYSRLGLAVFAIAAALLLTFMVVKSIRNPVSDLVGVINRLRDGDSSFATPHVGAANEIGDIARGLESFRSTVGELEEARKQREALQAEEARQAKGIGDLAVVLNEVVNSAREGDFSKRIPVGEKTGIILELASGTNDLISTVDRGLSETVQMMAALAKGDLTQRIKGEFKGSFLQLKTDANSMADKFRAIASRIAGVTRQVHGATGEIASGVADLSIRTEQHASSLEETSASMNELARSVEANAAGAQEVSTIAAAAHRAAIGGGDIAMKAVEAMSRIEGSSRQIGDIVGLIQEIAFQTNLLALNASVEAARAGDAGRGFAVVASEVRELARRAGQASKDIKSLIGSSDMHVRDGVALVRQAGDSLGEIVLSVKRVAGLVSEIASSTQEQSAGISQVSRAVAGMDEITQQNAALVEETNAALQSTAVQVDDLRTAVNFFQLGGSEEPPAQATSPIRLQSPNPVREQMRTLSRRVVGSSQEWKEL